MIHIENSWETLLKTELEEEYFQHIQDFLTTEITQGKIIYPQRENIFQAFELTPIKNLKVVILGQDPYHGANQAHGLSFSVEEDVKIPPSLRNIYKEIATQYPNWEIPTHGNLSHWANQ